MTDTATRPPTTNSASGSLAESFLARLKELNLITEADYARLFGPDRHKAQMLRIERGLLNHNVVADSQLGRIKSDFFNLPTVPEHAVPQPGIANGHRYRAVRIDVGNNRVSVAVVAPQPAIIEEVAKGLGANPADIDLYIGTLRGVDRMLAALDRAETVAVEKALPDIWELLDRVITDDASDLHLVVGTPPKLRIRGDLFPLEYEPITDQWLMRQVETMLPNSSIERELDSRGSMNPAVAFGNHRFRVVVARARGGLTVTARLLSSQIPTMDKIQLPQSIRDFIKLERGLVLVTGPTGSGKSTTLASMLQTLLMTDERSVLTLEEPIEYLLRPGPSSVVYQRERHTDFGTFHDGVVTALRQDPDVILVGEMRDEQTVKAALEAAETGHLVFGTLHTYDAASTIQRVADFFPAGQQDSIRQLMSYVLEGVVSQTLLKTASGKGRVAAYEIMRKSVAIANHMKTIEGLSQIRGAMEIAQRDGMQTLEQSLAQLVRSQKVKREDAEYKARVPEDLARLLDG